MSHLDLDILAPVLALSLAEPFSNDFPESFKSSFGIWEFLGWLCHLLDNMLGRVPHPHLSFSGVFSYLFIFSVGSATSP